VLHRWSRDGAIERMSLIASELVTNAVRHAKTDVVVQIEDREESVYLEVIDRGRDRPHVLDTDIDQPGGLGLPIVEALATSWGIRGPDSAGKGVWAEVRG
jgi:anti-sigma regulatory factor (Ser/Thr protein kinase)